MIKRKNILGRKLIGWIAVIGIIFFVIYEFLETSPKKMFNIPHCGDIKDSISDPREKLGTYTFKFGDSTYIISTRMDTVFKTSVKK